MEDNDDLFDAVDKLEKEQINIGYKEGKSVAQAEQFKTGFILGWQQCFHLQQELARIEGN